MASASVAPRKPSRVERVAALFRSRPGEWIDDTTLHTEGGCDAWRTRISDCRLRYGMTIDNRLLHCDWGTRSQYRYRPAAPAQARLFGDAA